MTFHNHFLVLDQINNSEYTGVESIKVSLENESADIVFQPDLITEEDLIAQIDDMGFEASIFVSYLLLNLI